MARAYRKKPVVVEAVQWTGENHAEMCEFIDPEVFEIKPKEGLIIHTLEGDHHASPGDYIIKGVNGEFYPCKPDIFAKTYEPATLTPQNEPLTLDSRLTSKMVTCPKGWKGVRGTRFYCPGCKKAVKKGETYCHKCGQALIFPVQRYDKENNRIWLDFSNRRPPEGEEDT